MEYLNIAWPGHNDKILLKRNKLGLLLIAVSATIIIMSFISSILTIETPRFSQFYNKKFIPAMINLSNRVPQNESIVSSDYYGNMVYFITHKLVIPHGVSSEKSLLYYMVKNNLKYLLVYENFSRIEELKPLFSHEGLKELDKDFREITNYTTDRKSIFHLYQLNKNWTLPSWKGLTLWL